MTEEKTLPRAETRIGMWLFIASEVLLFGGLFLLYSLYRFRNPADFHAASMELSLFDGAFNTCVLITSSLTAALAVLSLRQDRPARARLFLLATIGLACVFLGVKAFEWAAKFEHGLYPGALVLKSLPKGESLYFALYFMMTGLHAFHVIVGICVLSLVSLWIKKGRTAPGRPMFLENAALYWHLVDIIWIFLFPLFYLIT